MREREVYMCVRERAGLYVCVCVRVSIPNKIMIVAHGRESGWYRYCNMCVCVCVCVFGCVSGCVCVCLGVCIHIYIYI